jgi:succinate dehydrogenase/fumarate reductase flavoprotein subunit
MAFTPGEWDRSADLVVAGFGGAGAAAALAGAELGATVLILEKQPEDRHTPSTSMSGGIVMATNDVERATAYLDRCAGGMIPVSVSRAWAAKGTDLVRWLDQVGADLALERIGGAEHPEFAGAEAIESWAQSRPSERVPPGTTVREHKPGAPVNVAVDGGAGGGGGAGAGAGEAGAVRGARRIGYEYFAGLRGAVYARREIGVLYGTPVRHLIQDRDGRVIGVEAVQYGQVIRIRASRGVVLTTGGYEFSDEMKINSGVRRRPGRLRAPGRVAHPARQPAVLLHAAVPGRPEHVRRPAARRARAHPQPVRPADPGAVRRGRAR